MKNKNLFIQRLKLTAIFLAVYFALSLVPIPFVKTSGESGLDLFSQMAILNGGSSGGMKLFSLGMTPYFMSTLVMSILAQGISPTLAEYKNGTQTQRKQYEKISKLIFVALAVIQSAAFLVLKNKGEVLLDNILSVNGMLTMATLFAGALLCKYLADQITERGLCNGFILVIAFMLTRNLVLGLYEAYLSAESIYVYLGNIALLGVLLGLSVGIQRVAVAIPVAIDTLTTGIEGGRRFSPIKDTFRMNIMCVGITPIIYLSFILPIFSALGIHNDMILLVIALAAIYLFTSMTMRSNFNLDAIVETFLYRGVYLTEGMKETTSVKSKLKQSFERIVLIDTVVLFFFYAYGTIIPAVDFLDVLQISGVSGIQILLMGYAALDIFYTIKAYFVKDVAEIVY